ncbi:MAG: helix-turn-helix domain-containing protein [Alphaproteobacteria bacterium]|nr:helix-turn-helix domain-containing protein [Alphaproteobacteria bacterium]
MDARELVAWNLRRLRVARGVAQEALAVDAEIDRTYVSRLERNMENPSVAVLERLALALDVEIVEFFTRPKAGAKRSPVLKKGRKPKR